MLNRVIVMGRLTRDPELRRTSSGISVVAFSLAVERDFKPKDNSSKEVDFLDVVAWRGTADFVSKYLTKGRAVVVSGRLQVRLWKDQEGNKRKSIEILADSVYFADSKKGETGQQQEDLREVAIDADFPF